MLAVKPALGILLSALLVFGLGYYYHLTQAYWLLMSVLLSWQIITSITLPQKILLFAGTAIILASLVFSASMFVGHVWAVAIFLLLITFITVYLGLRYTGLWCGALTINLYVVLATGFPVNFADNKQRAGCILLGCGIAACMHFIFLKRSRVVIMRLCLADCLQKLRQLNQTIFSSYLHSDYKERLFVHEKALHEDRQDFLRTLSACRQLLQSMKEALQKKYAPVIASIEQIYEVILALGLLLYRIEDHSTFAVANKEFAALAAVIADALQALAVNLRIGKVISYLPEVMPETIYELTEVNRNALQVVASEPLVFVLFIQDLHALQDNFEQLDTAIAVMGQS